MSLDDLEHPLATHENLLRSGQRLSSQDSPLHTLAPDNQMLVYMKDCNNHRLCGLLADLVCPKHS